MKFQWDEQKRQANIRKHGIDFYDVRNVFSNPYLAWLDDREDYGEQRQIVIGDNGQVVVVIVCVDKGKKIIRIISVRRATKSEQKRYHCEILRHLS